MVKRTGPTNQTLQLLIQELKQKYLAEGTKLWRRLAEDLAKPSRQRRTVNLYVIDKFAQDGETVVVPGKILSVGQLTKKLNIAAFNFSAQAKEKINHSGKTMSIHDLLKQNPQGKNVRILG